MHSHTKCLLILPTSVKTDEQSRARLCSPVCTYLGGCGKRCLKFKVSVRPVPQSGREKETEKEEQTDTYTGKLSLCYLGYSWQSSLVHQKWFFFFASLCFSWELASMTHFFFWLDVSSDKTSSHTIKDKNLTVLTLITQHVCIWFLGHLRSINSIMVYEQATSREVPFAWTRV